ncbi:LysR family transcriptional regulator [Brevibacillus sp. SYP-B805]|uniref:LysR family transcriptional regulator n=1 Tax=Brevibacillus sp. SYP-B805 TaxID=1578199 RepID=UPI0013EAB1D8|nr:LysR family transcriptional regulator [Brevibacillus sp. SYP-B805]NGQ93707.1 LysR family transcriptional regulator [Brevibacillus sp. SYP-B805]
MDTRYLQTFREVAKCQSFTRAAEALGYAQSSVTTQIQNIESEFGVMLFERWGRKIRLTPAGETLLGYAEQVLALLDDARVNLSEEAQSGGTLTIGTVESLAAFYLPPYLQIFRQEHPRMKLMLQPGICPELLQGIREGVYDLAFLLDRVQDHPDLVSINLGEEELVVIASPEHRLASRKTIEVADFAGEDWIFTETGCSYRMQMEKVLLDSGEPIGSSLEFGSLEAIKQCVSYGLGLALLPKLAVLEDVRQGRLAILPFRHPEIRVYRQLVYHKKKRVTQTQQRLIDLLQTGGKHAVGQ